MSGQGDATEHYLLSEEMEIHTNVADAAHAKSDSSTHSGLCGRFGAGHDVQIMYEYTPVSGRGY